MASSFVTSWLTGVELHPFAMHPALVCVRLAYAVATLWLGWRLFEKFEMKVQGESPGVVPMAVLDAIPALRCRPAGAIANLVRKELRLHQPTVLIAALFAMCWLTALLLFSMTPARPAVADVVFTTLFISYVPLVLVVCGTTSIGEEWSLGIRAWSLTLPVSSMTQWAVKLAVMLFVGGALGFALPVALKQLTPVLVSLPAGMIQLPIPALSSAAVVLLVISFWSGTLFGHTVKAAVAAGVTVLSLWVCAVFAALAGQRMGVGSGWLTSLMVANQWSPDDLLLLDSRRLPWLVVLISMGVVALLALRQSLVAFRAPQVDRARIVRYALQLLVATAILSFIPNAYLRAAGNQYRSQPVRELQIALQQLSAASLAATGEVPGSVTAAELDATGQLSADARRWLAGSRISLRPSAPRTQAGERVRYVRTDVRFPSGSAFRMFYTVPPTP